MRDGGRRGRRRFLCLLRLLPLLLQVSPGDMTCLVVVLLLPHLGKSPRSTWLYWNACPLKIGVRVWIRWGNVRQVRRRPRLVSYWQRCGY